MATNEATRAEEKPTFEEWFDGKIKDHPNAVAISAEGYYPTHMSAILRHWMVLRDLSKDKEMFSADSEEFKRRQEIWWYHYGKMNILRSFLLNYYGIRQPNWQEEIMPERMYCGVLLSQEDFEKFILHPKSGFKKLEPDVVPDSGASASSSD